MCSLRVPSSVASARSSSKARLGDRARGIPVGWRLGRMASCEGALLPVPGGPRTGASSWREMKVPVERSKTRLRFLHLLVESEVEVVESLLGSRGRACFFRRSSRRSPRKASSSETRHDSRSMGASGSVWAWRRRASSTAAIRPGGRVCSVYYRVRSDSFYLLGSVVNKIAVLD